MKSTPENADKSIEKITINVFSLFCMNKATVPTFLWRRFQEYCED